MSFLHNIWENSDVWGVVLTIGAFALGTLINRITGKSWCNPLLLGSIFVIIFLTALSVPYETYADSAAPISYLLLPATVSLAIPLYEKWELLRKNTVAILAGISAGVITSLGSIVVIAHILKLERAQAVTLLPKSVTTAIGMDVAAELGGVASLAGAVIILTGIVGSLVADGLYKLLHIKDSMAKGIGIGTSSHAIGTTAALKMGDVEGAMSGLAIAVAGILTAVLAPLAAQFLP